MVKRSAVYIYPLGTSLQHITIVNGQMSLHPFEASTKHIVSMVTGQLSLHPIVPLFKWSAVPKANLYPGQPQTHYTKDAIQLASVINHSGQFLRNYPS